MRNLENRRNEEIECFIIEIDCLRIIFFYYLIFQDILKNQMPPKVVVPPKVQPKVPEKKQFRAEDYASLTVPVE